ncbi:hypothetical protein ACMGGD_27965 [Pseudomonas sp. BNK-6]|uniref:hypothetical protein n=1 Tax=unclassified Pseudomonas TaxID=196821 RepID=UPI003A8795A1
MSQQIGGPTRYQKPEESGMPHAQPTAQAMTALLRNAASVDAQKTKSLCCAAAGITALASSTTEARTPHEKLRGAATPGATLNAQSGPLAQPVEGYRGALGACTYLHNTVLQTDNVGRKTIIDNVQPSYKIGTMTITTHVVRPDHSKKIQDNQPSVIGAFEQNLIRAANLQRAKTLEDVPHPSFYKYYARTKGVRGFNSPGKQMLNFLDQASQLEAVRNFLLHLICFFASCFKSPLPGWNGTSGQDGTYRPNRLNPSSGVLLGVKRIKQHKQRPPQHSYRHKYPNDPNTGDPHLRRHAETFHALWLPAIKKKRACPFPDVASMKEVA